MLDQLKKKSYLRMLGGIERCIHDNHHLFLLHDSCEFCVNLKIASKGRLPEEASSWFPSQT
jgi:hypothetical protein